MVGATQVWCTNKDDLSLTRDAIDLDDILRLIRVLMEHVGKVAQPLVLTDDVADERAGVVQRHALDV